MDIDRGDEVESLGTSALKESNNSSRGSRKRHKVLKKALAMFLSVSLLSLLVSSFTGLSYLHSYTYYFSTFPLPFLTQALQRKYMFLLCNGILVFLAGLSGFWGALSSPPKVQKGLVQGDDHVQGVVMIGEHDDEQPVILQAAAAAPVEPLYEEAGAPAAGDSSMVIGEQEKQQLEAQEEEEEGKLLDEEEGEYWNEEGGGEGLEENEEEMVSETIAVGEEGTENETENDEGPGSINTEELNKKIEDFIRKMKEELRLEAQQHHLIVV